MDLLQDAETPLFSAFHHARGHAVGGLTLDEFLVDLQQLLESRLVLLWRHAEGVTEQLTSFPEGLAATYSGEGHSDFRYDPFGYSLSVGPAAEPPTHPPEWTFHADFSSGEFVWEGPPELEEESFKQILESHPTYRLEHRKRQNVAGRVRLTGRVVEKRIP